MSYIEWIVEESGARLDKYLSEVSELSRTRVQDLAKEKKIFVNGKAVSTFLFQNVQQN